MYSKEIEGRVLMSYSMYRGPKHSGFYLNLSRNNHQDPSKTPEEFLSGEEIQAIEAVHKIG